ncbi:YopX family protein [Latilactobacillus sakei]|uniref:YopX family protein n=1 Tax=Latilactobacillus sakei TaxID=1599 RepID=UPI003F52B11D
MREIKFRAWDKENKAFMPSEGYAICDGDVMGLRYGNEMEDVLTDQVEIMQYTGLKDMYGRDIYEGDVVEFEASLIRTKAEVKYSRNQFIVSMNSVMPRSLDLYLVKIIGNKFENPELLEAEK